MLMMTQSSTRGHEGWYFRRSNKPSDYLHLKGYPPRHLRHFAQWLLQEARLQVLVMNLVH